MPTVLFPFRRYFSRLCVGHLFSYRTLTEIFVSEHCREDGGKLDLSFASALISAEELRQFGRRTRQSLRWKVGSLETDGGGLVHRGGAGYSPRASNGNVTASDDDVSGRPPPSRPAPGAVGRGRARPTPAGDLRLPRIVVTAEGEPSSSVEVASRRGTSSSQDVRRAESVEALSGSHVHRHGAAARSSPFSKLHIAIIPAQLRSLNRETKAAKTVGVIVGCFVLCWAPFFTVYVLGVFCVRCTPPVLFVVFFWLGYCNSAINPFVYALCSKDFRFAFRRLLRCGSRYDRNSTIAALVSGLRAPPSSAPHTAGDSATAAVRFSAVNRQPQNI